jgi:regulator of PEP synthase PpsR (kinase-PPPase family)
VFFVSDGTGITAETFGHAVLTQFEMRFRQVRLPFIDTLDKAHDAVRKINEAFDRRRPAADRVFDAGEADLSDVIRNCKGMHMDLFQTFVARWNRNWA